MKKKKKKVNVFGVVVGGVQGYPALITTRLLGFSINHPHRRPSSNFLLSLGEGGGGEVGEDEGRIEEGERERKMGIGGIGGWDAEMKREEIRKSGKSGESMSDKVKETERDGGGGGVQQPEIQTDR